MIVKITATLIAQVPVGSSLSDAKDVATNAIGAARFWPQLSVTALGVEIEELVLQKPGVVEELSLDEAVTRHPEKYLG